VKTILKAINFLWINFFFQILHKRKCICEVERHKKIYKFLDSPKLFNLKKKKLFTNLGYSPSNKNNILVFYWKKTL